MNARLIWIDDPFAPGYRLVHDPVPSATVPAWFTATGADQHLDPRTRRLTETLDAGDRQDVARRQIRAVRNARRLGVV